MAKPSAKSGPAYFVADSSPMAVELQRLLTDGPYRCNIMMVANSDQALAILNQEGKAEKGGARPHVVLAYGGVQDGRAAALSGGLHAAGALAEGGFFIVVGPADQADSAGIPLAPLDLGLLKPLLARQDFWWVMAKLG
jgi:hypothetical protein